MYSSHQKAVNIYISKQTEMKKHRTISLLCVVCKTVVTLHVKCGKYWKFGTTPAFLLQ
jgi:hypothetical protein